VAVITLLFATHYIIACAGIRNHLAVPSVNWLLSNQNPDGSWGFFMPTAEETAECLQVLCIWEKKTGAQVKWRDRKRAQLASKSYGTTLSAFMDRQGFVLSRINSTIHHLKAQ